MWSQSSFMVPRPGESQDPYPTILYTFINKCLRKILKIYWSEKNQQQGTLGTNRARMCSRRDRQAKMELDQPHFAEANIWHNQAGPRVEPADKRKVGRPVKTWRRSVEEELKQHHLECGKKNSRKQSLLAQYSVCPLFHEEPNGKNK